jgi:flagellar motor switch protein FliG
MFLHVFSPFNYENILLYFYDMGNILRRGLDAYQRTINQKPVPSAEISDKKPDDRSEPPANPLAKTGGLLKTGKIPGLQIQKPALRVPRPGSVLPQEEDAASPAGKESKYRRVAKFLILVGADHAARIIAELDPEQVEAISREIATIRGIGADEGREILAEFRSLFSLPYGYAGASSGGVDTARRILYAAMGPEKGEALLNKTIPHSRENVFGFLEEFAPEQIIFLLKEESSVTAALILSRLPSKLSAGALGKLPPERRNEILKRIARQGEVAPEVLERVAAAVKEKARHIGSAKEIEIDGMQTLAAILKEGDYSFGDRIISELEEKNPGIGEDLKDRIYTLDDVVQALDRPLREKLHTMTDREIAILLKGRAGEFREKILSNVSAARRGLIREEGEILGAVPKRDCDKAAGEFLSWFRLAREEGNIILSDDEDVII